MEESCVSEADPEQRSCRFVSVQSRKVTCSVLVGVQDREAERKQSCVSEANTSTHLQILWHKVAGSGCNPGIACMSNMQLD